MCFQTAAFLFDLIKLVPLVLIFLFFFFFKDAFQMAGQVEVKFAKVLFVITLFWFGLGKSWMLLPGVAVLSKVMCKVIHS